MSKKTLLEKVHKIIGPLEPDDLNRLEASVKRDGVIVPVIVRSATGEIIDGKHRAEITNEYPIIELDVDEREAARQAVVLNCARRHLAPERMIKLVELLRREHFSQKEVAEMIGITQGRVSQIEGERGSQIEDGNINPNNAPAEMTWNEETQSYEAPEAEVKAKPEPEAEPEVESEPSSEEPEEQVDLRFKSGKKKKIAKEHKERKGINFKSKSNDYWKGVHDAKEACKWIGYVFTDHFTEKGLKWILTTAGVPKKVIKNLDKLSEIDFSISDIRWKAKGIADNWEEYQKFSGHIKYIKDQDDVYEETGHDPDDDD